MASFFLPVVCPDCGRIAVEDHHYKTGAGYSICQCCGCEVDPEAKYDREKIFLILRKKKERGMEDFF
ncbi:hypothetical protein E2K98_19865 [Bacillus salipaludis]|uniref:Uncharacterized protein n=1 Tax=Bacillus salipaludis TaxID=2547811 RepID=A0A4R5VPM9_9BACI|nr:hypothetical protein [Bacillus salipaludis]MDQ6598135.1 hypothetical protein [Bacillus salipaludis]TDK59479.1 hypothetical protein E2K98_19865 [Bacillus salipaludis]